MSITPWSSWERAARELFIAQYDEMPTDRSEALGRVGGDFPDSTDPWYIRIDKVGGRSDRLGGDVVLDVEVFAPSYGVAESVSYALEALLLRYPHVVEVDGGKFIFDSVTQNSGPDELPWEDEGVARLGATYVITARRR